jgi:putative lipoprotein
MISAIPLLATIITTCAKVDTKQKAKEELQSSLNKAVLLKEIVDQSSYEDFKKIYNQTLKSNLENINKLSEQKLKQEQQTIKNLITQVSVLNELDSIKNMSDLIDVVELENTKKQLQDFLNQYEKLLNQASVDTTIIDKLKSDAHQKRLDTKALIQKTILDLANKIKSLIKTSGLNKNIVELENDIQKLVNNDTKANFKKLYEDFKLIYTKLNDINDLINKELKALPFIKKLDDIVNVINTIYEQNHHFL